MFCYDYEFWILKNRILLSKASCDCPERVTDVHDDITYLHKCPGENDFNHRNLGEILISK